jgi:antitoxin PrlF
MSLPEMVTSKVTDRNQTTLPPAVRTVLGLRKGERLGYVIEGGDVRLVNASHAEHEDPVLQGFLEFLARDMQQRPEALTPLPESLIRRARELTADVAVDHDAPLDDLEPIF